MVAEVVGEFVVIGGVIFFPRKVGVGEGVDVAKEEIAKSGEPVFFEDVERVNDVAERL